MNIRNSQNFVNRYKNRILDLFATYQWIETLFFMYLYFPELKNKSPEELDKINKIFNTKTLGLLKNEYLQKFPEDDKNLIKELDAVITERNSFMHSFWISMFLMKSEDLNKYGKLLLDQFEKNADFLFEKMKKLN